MKNDKERQAFVLDESNWHRVGQDIMGKVRMRELEYKGRFWYRIDTLEHYTETNYSGGEFKCTNKVGWRHLRMYVLDKETRAFSETVSVTQIVNAIKEIDKEEKKEGKNNGKN